MVTHRFTSTIVDLCPVRKRLLWVYLGDVMAGWKLTWKPRQVPWTDSNMRMIWHQQELQILIWRYLRGIWEKSGDVKTYITWWHDQYNQAHSQMYRNKIRICTVYIYIYLYAAIETFSGQSNLGKYPNTPSGRGKEKPSRKVNANAISFAARLMRQLQCRPVWKPWTSGWKKDHLYPPVIKHGNGKWTTYQCFSYYNPHL